MVHKNAKILSLSLDPMNMGAMEGLQRMEQGNTDTGDPSYEELPESEIEVRSIALLVIQS